MVTRAPPPPTTPHPRGGFGLPVFGAGGARGEEAAWDERALAFVLDIRGMFQHVDAVMTENLFMVY